MSKRIKGIDRFAVRMTERVLAKPWWVIVATILVVLGLAGGVRHLGFSNNYRVFFSPDNPDLLAFENFQQTYTKNDNILFVLQPREGKVFSADMLQAIENLTAEAWKIPYAIRVDSVTNFQHSWADGDDLTVEDLVSGAESLPVEALPEKRVIALAEPLLKDNLISPDADTTGVNVTLQYPEESLNEVPEAAAVAPELGGRDPRAVSPDAGRSFRHLDDEQRLRGGGDDGRDDVGSPDVSDPGGHHLADPPQRR